MNDNGNYDGINFGFEYDSGFNKFNDFCAAIARRIDPDYHIACPFNPQQNLDDLVEIVEMVDKNSCIRFMTYMASNMTDDKELHLEDMMQKYVLFAGTPQMFNRKEEERAYIRRIEFNNLCRKIAEKCEILQVPDREPFEDIDLMATIMENIMEDLAYIDSSLVPLFTVPYQPEYLEKRNENIDLYENLRYYIEDNGQAFLDTL